ncbi:MAG: NADH-quinone oxidoreductase subunit C [Candidatus Acetothermia bacterium]|jgi:Ni,Fe-hydrogenase III component G/ferredoxin|nr:NADH-quinone oxidoreductase subunit C [Candidatus Acetothermia bacterium]MDH7504761.1 NADH-quinone oxidoreductase subunit C [Candidatus Acetothermia bacterium]
MKVKIANREAEIEVKQGAKLLEALAEKGYRLMSSCGGEGSCGMCRVKVLEGLKEPKPEYFGPLSEDLRKAGWVLSCQLKVESDLVIQLDEKLVERWPGEGVEAVEPGAAELSPLGLKLRRALPGFGCGGSICGYASCALYAEALARGEASPEACLPGGEPVRAALKRIIAAEKEQQALIAGLLEGIAAQVKLERRLDRRIYLRVERAALEEVARHLILEKGGRLATASGVDKPDSNEIELLYHISFDRAGLLASVRTTLPRTEPRSASVASFLPAAEFIEREIREFLGVEFIGHPRPERLIKAEEIPDDVYPLRKDFKLEDLNGRRK